MNKVVWAAAVVLALASLADQKGFRRYSRLRDDVQILSERNRLLSEKNRKMLLEIEALRGDARALETAAREELGFVRAGEIVIHLE